ncbi:RNase_H superfamily [Anaerolinea thermolimosa]|uniref:ribonuclease H-like domain-containing protein n=1 Tax=Anaerolinea thermolimosa TaxID=229919 RepID=UPI000780AA58|nr:ribonuclease H-like domain-containing protein [Anaerolinea thermolimosa]GAP06374.1 RNase_H superfamily [Anaerolinea thermolimosa]
MSSLLDRLKILGVPLKEQEGRVPESVPAFPITKVIEGNEYPTKDGNIFFVEKTFPQEYLHGVQTLSSRPILEIIHHYLGIGPEVDYPQIVFLDTETSGLAGGSGVFAFMIGLGFFIENGFKVIQIFMRTPVEEPGLLTALDEFLNPFQLMVSFNGKSFDIPLLNTRYVLNQKTSPLEAKFHLDLLQLARKIWRDRLVNRSLGELEREILAFTREEEDVPGYLIPQLYFDYLKTGNATPLRSIFYHNAIDIVSMAALFLFITQIIENPLQYNIPSLDVAALARLFEGLGKLEEAASLYEYCIDRGLPSTAYIKTIERYALMRKKQGHIELSSILWMKAAERGYIPAHIELAKIHEHHSQNLSLALEWVNRAIERVQSDVSLPGYLRKEYLNDLNHRNARLNTKITRRTDLCCDKRKQESQ